MPRVKAIARKLTMNEAFSGSLAVDTETVVPSKKQQSCHVDLPLPLPTETPLSLTKPRASSHPTEMPSQAAATAYTSEEPLNLCVRESPNSSISVVVSEEQPVSNSSNTTAVITTTVGSLSVTPVTTPSLLSLSFSPVKRDFILDSSTLLVQPTDPEDEPTFSVNKPKKTVPERIPTSSATSNAGNSEGMKLSGLLSTNKTSQSQLQTQHHHHGHQEKRPCPLCGKLLRPGSMREHLDRHTGQGRFPCKQCDKTFSRSSALEKHILTHTGDKPFACPHCEKRYRQKVHLNEHMRSHTGERPFSCSQCHLRLASKSLLNRHMRTHREMEDEIEEEEMIDHGSQASPTSPEHVQGQPQVSILQSPTPPTAPTTIQQTNPSVVTFATTSGPLTLTSGSLAAVAAAKSIVEALQALTATTVTPSSATTATITGGMRGMDGPLVNTNHLVFPVATAVPVKDDLLFRCPRCSLDFPSAQALQCHDALIHNNNNHLFLREEQHSPGIIPNPTLRIISSSASSSGPLDGKEAAPLSTHSEAFDCSDCPRSYKSLKQLRDHEKSHHQAHRTHSLESSTTSSKPQHPVYKCDVCGRVFREKRYLRNHREVHAEQKRFCCHLCGGTFTRKASLNTHVLRLHGQVPSSVSMLGTNGSNLYHESSLSPDDAPSNEVDSSQPQTGTASSANDEMISVA